MEEVKGRVRLTKVRRTTVVGRASRQVAVAAAMRVVEQLRAAVVVDEVEALQKRRVAAMRVPRRIMFSVVDFDS